MNPRLKLMLAILLLTPLWSLGVWGSLQFHTLDLHLGHSICGPWGCGPRTEALIGYHSFWTLLLAPVFVMAWLYFAPMSRSRLGTATIALGCLIVLATAGWSTWQMWQSSGSVEYLVQKFFFSVATNIDVPMVQLIVGGLALRGV